MRRVLVVSLVVGLAACFGYERPRDRRHDAIGAPQADVGSTGLQPLRRSDQRTGEPGSASAWGAAREKYTEVARVRKRSADRITLERATGDRVDLQVMPLTRITMNGKPANASALPEGAEVRASYVLADGQKIAERIEVLGKDKETKR